MGFFKSVSRVQVYKGVNLVFSVISLGIGLFSHFQSSWVQYTRVFSKPTYYGFVMPYQLCTTGVMDQSVIDSNFLKSCPDIAWERLFVSVIIICFVLSLINFALEFIRGMDLRKKPYKIADIIYHILAAVALVIAGVLYIFSALLIYDILDLANAPDYMPEHKFRTVEKLASAGCVFLQAIFYACTAYQIIVRK